MEKSQGRWMRALAYGATAVLVISACSQAANPTTAPSTVASSAPATQVPTTAPATTGATTAPASTTPSGSPTTSTMPSSSPVESMTPSGSPVASGSSSTGGGVPGGTIYMLKNATDFDYYDPQRVYTGEDLAFFGATIMRALVAYKLDPDPALGTTLVPDMATDTGTANADATQWDFTLKDGISWQDGSPVKCEDIKYGVSRTYATDVINGGPTYAIAYLNIPTVDGFTKEADGTATAGTVPSYAGPYVDDIPNFYSDEALTKPVVNDKAAFESAVTCDGNKITFHLKQTVADFNYTTTLGFGAVPNPVDHPGIDTGEAYVGDAVWSDGPYKITKYEPAAGGSLVLERNDKWDRASDDYRGAYPDKWQIDFGLDLKVIDARLMQSTGNDAFAIDYGGVQPENLTTVFSDSHTAAAQYAGRAFSDFDVYSRYYWINTAKVTNLKIRQAMAAALDREAIRLNGGGDFVGDFADGAIKPNIGQDYAPTGFWDTLLGKQIPATGDAEYAKQLIQESGEAAPTLTWNYAISPTGDKNAAIVQQSLEKAGFKVKIQGIDPAHYYSTVFNNDLKGDFGTGGWGADWPNASTVIPPLFTDEGGWNLSNVQDGVSGIPDWTAQVKDAQTTVDRAAQAAKWQTLNKTAVEQVWIIPTFFGLAQNIGGTNVGGLYRWSAYSSWPYAQLYVKGS